MEEDKNYSGDDSDQAGGAPASTSASAGGNGGGRAAINAGRWTREEHQMFLKGLEIHGKEWKHIAEMIRTRTVVQIRTHAQKYFQKVAKSTGGPVMSTSKKGDVVRPPQRKRRNTGAGVGGSFGSSEDDEDDIDDDEAEYSPPPKLGRGMRDTSGSAAAVAAAAASSSSSSAAAAAASSAASASAAYGSKRGAASGGRKPNSISVPSFPRPANGKARKSDEGGVTPRTVAAATILLRPRIQHKIQTGGDTPKTREQASWLASHQERAAQVLGKRRRTSTIAASNSNSNSNSSASGARLSWDTAATAHR